MLLTTIGELDEILNCGATESVERLIVVAYDANVFVARSKLKENPFLDRIRVLIFVYDDVTEDLARLGILQQMVDCDRLDQGKIGSLHATIALKQRSVSFVSIQERMERSIAGAFASRRRVNHFFG